MGNEIDLRRTREAAYSYGVLFLLETAEPKNAPMEVETPTTPMTGAMEMAAILAAAEIAGIIGMAAMPARKPQTPPIFGQPSPYLIIFIYRS